jgi:hypothetical protein
MWSETNPTGRVVGDHNPDRKFGSKFVWEKTFPPPDSKWIQDGGSDGGDGVHADMISGMLSRNVDIAREDGRLDWLLPNYSDRGFLDDGNVADIKQALTTHQVIQSNEPSLAGVANPLGATSCSYPWPSALPDAMEPNDIIEQAKAIPRATTTKLSIHRSSLHSQFGTRRTAPIYHCAIRYECPSWQSFYL